MNKNIGFVVILIGVLTGGAASAEQLKQVRISSAIAKVVVACSKVAAVSEVACPRVKKFMYSGTDSIGAIKDLLNGVLDLQLSVTDAEGAREALLPRIEAYRAVLAHSDKLENVESYLDSTHRLLSIMSSMSNRSGNLTLKDVDTYWAPSVNASVVVVVNPTYRTIYAFWIGDIDG